MLGDINGRKEKLTKDAKIATVKATTDNFFLSFFISK